MTPSPPVKGPSQAPPPSRPWQQDGHSRTQNSSRQGGANGNNQSPGRRWDRTVINDYKIFNENLVLQYKNCLANRLDAVDLTLSPGNMNYSYDLLTKITGFCNGDQNRARILCNLMASEEGCSICIKIIENNQDSQDKWVLPHLTYQARNQVPSQRLGLTIDIPFRGPVSRCPMGFILQPAKLMEIFQSLNLCTNCNTRKDQGRPCGNHRCRQPGTYCSACRCSGVLCKCPAARKHQYKIQYEATLLRYDCLQPNQTCNNIPDIFIGSASWSNKVQVYKEEMKSYQTKCNMISTGQYIGMQPDIFHVLYVNQLGVYNGVLTHNSREMMIQDYPDTRLRQEGKYLFKLFFIEFSTRNLLFISDSACSELCMRLDTLGHDIPCTSACVKHVQVAGGKVSSRQAVRLLLPVADNPQGHSHYEAEAVLMNQVIENLPDIDLTDIVTEIMYPHYLHTCSALHQKPLFSIQDLPLKLGGSVTGLMGERIFQPVHLYTCPLTNLQVLETPFLLRGKRSLAISGLVPWSLQSKIRQMYPAKNMNCLTSIEQDTYQGEEVINILAGVTHEDSDEEDQGQEADGGTNFSEVYKDHVAKKMTLKQKEIIEKTDFTESNLLNAPEQANFYMDKDWNDRNMEASVEEGEEEVRKKETERKIMNSFYKNPEAGPSDSDIKLSQQMILDSITANKSGLQSVIDDLSTKELEYQFSFGTNQTIPPHNPSHLDFPTISESNQQLKKLRRSLRVSKPTTKYNYPHQATNTSYLYPHKLGEVVTQDPICPCENNYQDEDVIQVAATSDNQVSTGHLSISPVIRWSKTQSKDLPINLGDEHNKVAKIHGEPDIGIKNKDEEDMICTCPHVSCIFHGALTQRPLKRKALDNPRSIVINNICDDEGVASMDVVDIMNDDEKAVIDQETVPNKFHKKNEQPNPTFDVRKPLVIPRIRVLQRDENCHMEDVINITNNEGKNMVDIVVVDSDEVESMMNQPDNLAGVLEPAPDNINQLSVPRRLSPIPENPTEVWHNFSYDIQRILDKAESGDDDWDQFSKDIQRTLEVLDIRDSTGDLNNWLSLQDIRTPHTNQYGWQSCEFNVLTKNQKKAVHLAHLHLDMIKENSERLQTEGHLSNYKLYIDMVRLWLYSIRKFGHIDCGMALNNIEKIVDDYGAIAMNNLEERKDIWFLTKKLISTLEADSTAIQIINTKEIEEMSQLTTEIVQVKLFLRQDNPSSLDSLISHLSLTDSVDQYMDSNFSGFKPSKRNIKDYILQPVPNTFKLIRTVTQNKVNVEWSGAASNLIRLQNIGTKSRVNEIPILTPNTTPGLELTWTHTLYSCKEDNISLAPWLRERAKDHLYTITGNVYIGKRLNKNVQPDAEIIAATMENPQDSRPTHYISIDFSSYIGREVQRLKQYLISMDGQLAQYDGGPCHLTLLAFQMPLGGYNMVKDSFEHFGREVSKIAKSRMLIKAGKIKILEPGNITIDIIGGKLEQLNRILVNIFQENGMRVDLKFSPHATLFKFNHKLQRGPDTKAAMRVIANPAWEIVDKLHIYPMGKKNRIPWFTMKFSIELGWEVTENDTCNPAKPFYNEEDDSGPDEDQRGGLITSQQPLSNVNQPQARVSTPPCQTQPSSANDTSKHSRIALPLSGRQMRQKAAQNLIHSTMDKNLALKPCSHVTQYSSDGLSAPPRNIISNGYEAQITDADNCKTVNQMEQLHGCKTNMTKDVELIRPHTPLINTGCQSPVTCGHNPNCMMINKEAQNDDIPITLTYTQGKPGEESQDYYLNTTGEIIPSLHIHPHLGDTDIISYFPELAPWDDEDKSIVGLVKTDDVENKPFDIKHIQEEHQVLRAFLFPQLDPYSRCMDCLSCHCAPDVLFKSKDLQDSTKEQDNAVIFESIKPIQLEDGSIRFITKYPVDYQLLNTYFLNTNRRQVLMELDRKLKKLSPLQAASSQQEFSKLVGLGFLIPWSQMPHKVQTLIESHAYQHYICASPAFKEDSLSTSTRIAFNASSKNTQGKSLNSLMPTGRFKMDLASSFRHFRYHNVGMHADLSKYFNRIFLSSQSMHLSRLIWRQDCSLANPPGEYIMSRLFYGMKSSTSICSAALCYISAFVQRKCTGSCKIGTPCTGIQCELVKLISKIYVDDIFHSTITIQRAMRLKQYCIKVFGIFGFQFKDFLISGENDEKSPMLKDGTCSLGGYNWRPLDDMIKVKTPKLSNGKKFRNSIIQSSSFSYIDTQGQRKTIQPPPLIVKTFDQDETISLEAISNIFEGVPKTIRFLLSKGGLCYDPHGLIMPLGNQLRYITSRIIKKWGLYYEQEISEQEYTRWLKSFHQFILGSKLWFSRKMNAKKAATHGKTYLVGVSDYGQMVNSSLYIVHQLQDGTFQTTHLAGAGMLLDASAPRGELQGVSIISQMVNCVRQELVNFIDFVVVATDSMISIFWCQKNPQDLKPYIKKRVENIQRHINPRTELYHCKTAYLSADIGTKFGSELHGEPLITAEVVEEGSLYKTGFGWMNDIPGAVEARIITPAEVAIKNHNGIILPDKERRSYLSGFRWSNFTKLQSHSLESVIQADTTIMQGSVLPADIAVSCVEDPQELQNEGSETIKDVSKISQMFAPSGADQDAVIEDEFLAAYFLTSNYDIDSSINMSGEHNTMYATSVVDPCILAPLVVDGDIDVTHRMASAPDSIAEHDNSALDVTHRMISAPDSLAENDDKVCLPFENIDSLTISNSKDCSSVPIPKPHLDPDFLAHLENKLYFNNKYYTLGFEELTPGDDDHIAIVDDDALANHSNDADDTALVLITSTADSPPDSIGASFVPGLTEGNLEGPSLVNLNHTPHESNNSKQQPETMHFENGNSFCINVEPTSHQGA